MPFCPECGKNHLPHVRLCPHCGRPLRSNPPLSEIAGLAESRNRDTAYLRIKQGFGILGAALFISGLFIPAVLYRSADMPVSLLFLHSLYGLVLLLATIAVLFCILLDFTLVPFVLGMILATSPVAMLLILAPDGTLQEGIAVLETGAIFMLAASALQSNPGSPSGSG